MDATEKQPLVLTRTYDAPVGKVWRALTDKEQMVQWYFPMMEDFRPEVGFTTEFDVVHPESGNHYLHRWTVTEAVHERKIAYEWKYPDYPGNSVVSFELEPEGEKTKLTLTFRVLETFEPKKYPELSIKGFTEGWTHFVDVLGKFVE